MFTRRAAVRNPVPAIRAFLPIVALTLCHCVGAELRDAARTRGATDLGCPIERVVTYRAAGGVYVARGCGHWVDYDCVVSATGTVYQEAVCVPHGKAEVHDEQMHPDPE